MKMYEQESVKVLQAGPSVHSYNGQTFSLKQYWLGREDVVFRNINDRMQDAFNLAFDNCTVPFGQVAGFVSIFEPGPTQYRTMYRFHFFGTEVESKAKLEPKCVPIEGTDDVVALYEEPHEHILISKFGAGQPYEIVKEPFRFNPEQVNEEHLPNNGLGGIETELLAWETDLYERRRFRRNWDLQYDYLLKYYGGYKIKMKK